MSRDHPLAARSAQTDFWHRTPGARRLGRARRAGQRAGRPLDELIGPWLSRQLKLSPPCGHGSSCLERGLDVECDATAPFLASRGPFDAAVVLDVIEHLIDPGAVSEQLHATMRPGGQLVITTGDFGSLLARAMGRRWRSARTTQTS